MKYNMESTGEVISNYQKAQNMLAGVDVVIPNEVSIDPLLLVRTINGGRGLDNMLPLIVELVKNQEVSFMYKGKVLFKARFNSAPDLSTIFGANPEYLDLLNLVCYGIMLKKLTPPSPDLKPHESGSAQEELPVSPPPRS